MYAYCFYTRLFVCVRYVTKELAEDKAYIDMCLVDSEKVQEEDIALCARVQVLICVYFFVQLRMYLYLRISIFTSDIGTSVYMSIYVHTYAQTGLRSSAYGLGGRYAPSMESGEFMFHKLLQRDLEAAAKRLDQEGTRH